MLLVTYNICTTCKTVCAWISKPSVYTADINAVTIFFLLLFLCYFLRTAMHLTHATQLPYLIIESCIFALKKSPERNHSAKSFVRLQCPSFRLNLIWILLSLCCFRVTCCILPAVSMVLTNVRTLQNVFFVPEGRTWRSHAM